MLIKYESTTAEILNPKTSPKNP